MIDDDYGFTVKREDDTDLWRVTLPHRCDDWEITRGESYGQHIPHEQAIADLRRFIGTAQTALYHLTLREEIDD